MMDSHSAAALQALKQVFYLVSFAVMAAMPSGRLATIATRWNTRATPTTPQLLSKFVAVVAFVGHRDHSAELWTPRGLGNGDIGLLPRRQADTDRSSAAVHPSTQFGVQTTFGASDGLLLLATSGIAGVLMHLDMTGIQEP
jgi:hypothetical protein